MLAPLGSLAAAAIAASPAGRTDHADCGPGAWCIQGNCVAAGATTAVALAPPDTGWAFGAGVVASIASVAAIGFATVSESTRTGGPLLTPGMIGA